MILVFKKVGCQLNYKKFISAATYYQAALLSVGFILGAGRTLTQHLMCKGQGCCLAQLQGVALQLHSV